jgi:DNA mismatch repair protein MutS
MAFTPAIIQYLDIKKEHEDCILFFRMGDFYETFFEDAKTCSKVLDIVLTSKNKNSENSVPMAGIPYHSADKYITKLINHGYKVAIAEQTSEPIPGKIVEREVVNIITPGTYIQETKKEFTYTMALTFLPHTT